MSELDNNNDKFKKLKKDIEDSTQTLKDAKILINNTQNYIEFVSEGVDRAIWDGEYIMRSFDRVKEFKPNISLIRRSCKFLKFPKLLRN